MHTNAGDLTSPLPLVLIDLARLLERRIQGALRAQELSINQIIALVRIAHEPSVSRADLARRMRISPQAVGQILNQLVARGLVERTETAPGLPIEVSVTDPGYRFARDAMREIEVVNDAVMALFRPNLAHALDGAARHVLSRLAPCQQPVPSTVKGI